MCIRGTWWRFITIIPLCFPENFQPKFRAHRRNLMQTIDSTAKTKKSILTAVKIKTKGFKFNREEATSDTVLIVFVASNKVKRASNNAHSVKKYFNTLLIARKVHNNR